MAMGSRSRSARMWAAAIGCVTYGSPDARCWSPWASIAKSIAAWTGATSISGSWRWMAWIRSLARVGTDGMRGRPGARGLERPFGGPSWARGGVRRLLRDGATVGLSAGASGLARWTTMMGSSLAARSLRSGPVAEPPKGFIGGGALVPRHLAAVGDEDVVLVTLAREQHDVARPGRPDRGVDRLAPIQDQLERRATSGAGRLGSGRDVLEDGLGVLVPGVLVGGDDQPAALRRDPTHHRPLLPVAFPAGPEQCDQCPTPSLGNGRELVEDEGERGRRVGVVDDDGEGLAQLHPLHPAGDVGQALETLGDRLGIESDRLPERGRGKGVVGVEAAGQLERDSSPPAG